MSSQPLVRNMLPDDISTIVEIEQATYAFPWSQTLFEDCFQENYRPQVLELEGQLIGYAVILATVEEGHVMNFCIAPDFQQRGYGMFLLKNILGDTMHSGVRKIIIEVRVSNQAAINLYQKVGFCQIGVRKKYYPAQNQSREDALVLVYTKDD